MQTSLNGKWNLLYKTKKIDLSIPGDIHSALLNAKEIPDPYYGKNEESLQYLNREDFEIETTFEYKKITDTHAILEMTYADTVFDLYINDIKAGSGNNMFIRHRFDITKFVLNGTNKIRIKFYSSEKAAEDEAKKLPYPVPYNKADIYSPHRNLIRKCQCHSGWDWGPCIMTSGIYGDIFIETVHTGLFNSIRLEYTHESKNNLWKIKATLEFESLVNCEKDFFFTVNGQDIDEIEIQKNIHLKTGKNLITAIIPVKNPSVWKTSSELQEEGLEENPVYFISVSYKDQSYIKTYTKQFCFNLLKCITKKEKNGGRSIYFENGISKRKIFAKGINWIPVDALPSRWTFETYYNLLKSTRDANMNCVRVWGGGIYEKDFFYEICDRLGLIVWQDFMFACALYPVTEPFLNSVKEEVTYQINRLQHHACIGLWCGNNENFGTLTWFHESRNNRDRYLVDYDRLYQGLIRPIVKELDPGRLWWPSSPSAGPDDFADNWHCDNQGDMHYWSVWHEKKNFDAYLDINPRFVSEFGYESMVSLECVKTYSEEKDLNFTSPVSEYHQRSPSGNTLMLESFARYFRFPNGFENQIYLSQVQQAVAIRTAIDWWRSLEPYCMGAIVWQLNDVWPGPSWSSIEYGGKWKLLHYEEKKAFEPFHLSQMVKNGKFTLAVVNDYKEDTDCTIILDFLDFSGNKICKSKSIKATCKAGKGTEVFTSPCITKELKENSYFIQASATGLCGSKKKFFSETTVFPFLYKKCEIEKPEIKVNCHSTSSLEKDFVEIELNTDKPAFFVSLDSHHIKGIFSDNCFTLIPGKPKKVTFIPENKKDLSKFEKILSVRNLRDTY